MRLAWLLASEGTNSNVFPVVDVAIYSSNGNPMCSIHMAGSERYRMAIGLRWIEQRPKLTNQPDAARLMPISQSAPPYVSAQPDQRSWMRIFAENVMPPTAYKRLDEASRG
jgi:hypothetical protein